MPLNLTEEQIIQLAPDAASVKAGKGLAVPGKWVLLACSERAVWGHCQGSGKNPYQTAIDLNDDGAPAYDKAHAAFLAELGVPTFACTPDKFPDLMAAALSKQDIGMWVSQKISQ